MGGHRSKAGTSSVDCPSCVVGMGKEADAEDEADTSVVGSTSSAAAVDKGSAGRADRADCPSSFAPGRVGAS